MKDYAAIISIFYDYDTAYYNYMMDPEADSYDVVQKLGFISLDDDDSSDIQLANIVNKKFLELV